MRWLDLFSGIGMYGLGLEQAGAIHDAQQTENALLAECAREQRAKETIRRALQPSPNELPPQVGDIVAFMVRAHPIMGVPYEVIGRVERDSRGLHAGNRYLPLDGVRVVERTHAAAEALMALHQK